MFVLMYVRKYVHVCLCVCIYMYISGASSPGVLVVWRTLYINSSPICVDKLDLFPMASFYLLVVMICVNSTSVHLHSRSCVSCNFSARLLRVTLAVSHAWGERGDCGRRYCKACCLLQAQLGSSNSGNRNKFVAQKFGVILFVCNTKSLYSANRVLFHIVHVTDKPFVVSCDELFYLLFVIVSVSL